MKFKNITELEQKIEELEKGCKMKLVTYYNEDGEKWEDAYCGMVKDCLCEDCDIKIIKSESTLAQTKAIAEMIEKDKQYTTDPVFINEILKKINGKEDGV